MKKLTNLAVVLALMCISADSEKDFTAQMKDKWIPAFNKYLTDNDTPGKHDPDFSVKLTDIDQVKTDSVLHPIVWQAKMVYNDQLDLRLVCQMVWDTDHWHVITGTIGPKDKTELFRKINGE